jgi:hypothetical protein
MVKVTESEFNERKFYIDQGKEFIKRMNNCSNNDELLYSLGITVHDLPRNMGKFKQQNLVGTHRDHEVFKKFCIDVSHLLRQMGDDKK